MLDVLRFVADHLASGPVALATVVSTTGSSPLPAGSMMAVTGSGEVAGSVSGGCVEAAVFELAQQVLRGGQPGLHRFGFADADALEVGLTCGGALEVFVQAVAPGEHDRIERLLREVGDQRAVGVATVTAHPDPAHVGLRVGLHADGVTAGSTHDEHRILGLVGADAQGMLDNGVSGSLTYGAHGERLGDAIRVFVQTWVPAPRLIIVGAVDFSAALARVAKVLGYRVTLCDARPVFATPQRFPAADEVVVDWPHRYLRAEIEAGRIDARTAVCVLTHDTKFDVPVLEAALACEDLGYVGAMGSRRTHDDRVDRLRAAGVAPDGIARLHSPIGLDLGARTPDETALSIAAEIVASRHGGSGRPLATTQGDIHSPEELRPVQARA
jgi:xanthine dehydrogenase accessory factor